MKINKIGYSQSFKAILPKKTEEAAMRDAEKQGDETYMEEHIKRISSYGDDKTVLHFSSFPSDNDKRALVLLYASNERLPVSKTKASGEYLPLFVSHNSEYTHIGDADAADRITMITPGRVNKCEQNMFRDIIRDNGLDPKKELAQLKDKISAQTYKNFLKAVFELEDMGYQPSKNYRKINTLRAEA